MANKKNETVPKASAVPSNGDLCLHKYLTEHKQFETDEDRARRVDIIRDFTAQVQAWTDEVLRSQGASTEKHAASRARVYVSGSVQMGVSGPASDMDLLTLLPLCVPKSTYVYGQFEYWQCEEEGDAADAADEDEAAYDIPRIAWPARPIDPALVLAERLRRLPYVDDLLPIPDATIPLVKLTFRGVCLDLTFAEFDADAIPRDFDIHAECALEHFDDYSEFTLRGLRANHGVIAHVRHMASFRTAFHAVRYWAKRRCVYSHGSGFLGGISWAILLIRAAQMLQLSGSGDEPSAAHLLVAFFRTFARWKWSMYDGCDPISLRPLPERRRSRRQEVMPIYTATVPEMDTAFHVTVPTLGVLRGELRRGADLLSRSINSDDDDDDGGDEDALNTRVRTAGARLDKGTLDELFRPYRLRDEFAVCVCIEISAGSRPQLLVWEAWVVTRIRGLLNELGGCGYGGRPLPQGLAVEGGTKPEAYAADAGADAGVGDQTERLRTRHFAGVRFGEDEVAGGLDGLMRKIGASVEKWTDYVFGWDGVEAEMDLRVDLQRSEDVEREIDARSTQL